MTHFTRARLKMFSITMFANNAKKRGFWSSKELLIKSHDD